VNEGEELKKLRRNEQEKGPKNCLCAGAYKFDHYNSSAKEPHPYHVLPHPEKPRGNQDIRHVDRRRDYRSEPACLPNRLWLRMLLATQSRLEPPSPRCCGRSQSSRARHLVAPGSLPNDDVIADEWKQD
jgi:hypothetical protein